MHRTVINIEDAKRATTSLHAQALAGKCPENPILQQLALRMAAEVIAGIASDEKGMLAAIEAVRDAAEEEEKEPIFTLSLSGKIKLDKSKIETALAYGVRKTVKGEYRIDDPNQTEFEFKEDE